MLKSLCLFTLVGILTAQASKARDCCCSDGTAPAVQPAAPSAPAAQAQRTGPNRSFSYQPTQGAFGYSTPYYGGGRYSWGLRPADAKARGNYTPYRGF